VERDRFNSSHVCTQVTVMDEVIESQDIKEGRTNIILCRWMLNKGGN